jgi:hypothetical protein
VSKRVLHSYSANTADDGEGGGIASFIADVDINKGSEVSGNTTDSSTGMDISLCGFTGLTSTLDLNGGSSVDDIYVDELSDLFISKRAEYGDCGGAVYLLPQWPSQIKHGPKADILYTSTLYMDSSWFASDFVTDIRRGLLLVRE